MGHDFYHSFGRVLDGTPCSPGAQGLCVAGRCLVRIPGPAPPRPLSSTLLFPPYLAPKPHLFSSWSLPYSLGPAPYQVHALPCPVCY